MLQVLFDVPRYIADGLASGEMIRRGGVVQWAGGEARGEVVAWLKEVGGLARAASPVSAPLAEQLSALGMASNVALVGQAVTLGFSVLSFAVLNHKLNALAGRVDQVVAELVAVREEIGWLDRRHDIALDARLRAALDQGRWAQETGRLDALVGVRAVLVETEQHYRGLVAAMLEGPRAYSCAALFATYQGYVALAGVARGRCEAVLDGAAAGMLSLTVVEATLAQVDQAYRDPLRNLGAHLHLLRLGPRPEQVLRPALVQMSETLHRVEGYSTELAYCAREGLPLSEWERLGHGGTDDRLALVVPDDRGGER
jgi:hypothetical protein